MVLGVRAAGSQKSYQVGVVDCPGGASVVGFDGSSHGCTGVFGNGSIGHVGVLVELQQSGHGVAVQGGMHVITCFVAVELDSQDGACGCLLDGIVTLQSLEERGHDVTSLTVLFGVKMS